MVVEFIEEADKQRVLDGQPWLFDRHLLALEEFDGNTVPTQMAFTRAAFWLQVDDMPLGCISKKVGYNIGAFLGKVEVVGVKEDGIGWGKFLRIMEEIDLTKPLESP
jgi:hypothetical protein